MQTDLKIARNRQIYILAAILDIGHSLDNYSKFGRKNNEKQKAESLKCLYASFIAFCLLVYL